MYNLLKRTNGTHEVKQEYWIVWLKNEFNKQNYN